jgi:hypothetical protein
MILVSSFHFVFFNLALIKIKKEKLALCLKEQGIP